MAENKLDIGDVLTNIDTVNLNYIESLSDDDKKLFQPYVVLRWLASLNDSVVLKYRASEVEAITGKWKNGGKETCLQIVEAINNLTGNVVCTGVSKTGDQQTRNWYISFSVSNSQVLESVASNIYSLTKLMPIISAMETTTETYKKAILAANEYANVSFWDISKHPELQYKLMCIAGAHTIGEKKSRAWLPFVGGSSTSDKMLLEFLRLFYDDPCMRINEALLIIKQIDKKEFVYMVESSGFYDSSDSKKIISMYEKHIKK